MPWRPGPGGGFTTGRPWLPLPADQATRNVEVEAADRDSILWWYRRLLAVRREVPALQSGGQRLLSTQGANVLAYLRAPEGGESVPGERASATALVALNFGGGSASLKLPTPEDSATWRVALSTAPRAADQRVSGSVQLGPLEAVILLDR